MARSKFSHSNNDFYYTPVYAVDIIKPYVKEGDVIWCPFDTKDSNFVKELSKTNKVHYTHIDDGDDFLEYVPEFDYDVIISNPPFSIKNEILDKCYKLNKPFCLLLPFTMFNSISSVGIIDDDIQFIIMDRRISYNGERPNFTSWYVCKGFLPTSNVIYKFEKDTVALYNIENNKGVKSFGDMNDPFWQ